MTVSHLRSWLLVAISTSLLLGFGTGCTKELRKARHLSKGNHEFEAKHYAQAEIEYLNVLNVAKLNPVAVRQLGIIYQEEWNLRKAHAYLTKAVELEPDNFDAHVHLAMNAVAIGDLKTAVDEANWVLKKKPGNLEALEVIAATPTNAAGVQALTEQIQNLRKADSDRASYHVALGGLALRAGAVTNAETEFKQALALDPKCGSAHAGLGAIYLSRKDLPAADQSLKAAAELSPIRSFRQLKYAEYQLGTGRVDDAKRRLDQITKEAPDYLPAWSLLAQLAFSEKRYDDCHQITQRILGREPANYEALMFSGNIQMAKGDAAKAVAEFSKMETVYGRAPQVQYQLARAYLMTHETGRATACLEKAVAADKNFLDARLLLAELKINQGDADQVIPSLTELVKRQPQVLQAHLLLAGAYLAKKDVDQAVAVCRNMAEVFPKSREVPILIGEFCERQGKLDEARKSFERALELSPGFFDAIEHLVKLDMAEQKYAEAIARVQAQIDKDPKAAEPWVLMASIDIAKANDLVAAENKNKTVGVALLKPADVPAAQAEVTKAEAALQKAIELNPNLSAPFLMLAELYVAAGKQQQALERLNELIARKNDANAWLQVGQIQESLKNYPAARDAYEKVIAVSPNYIPALNNLAYLYCERLNELDKAYQMADKAHTLAPPNSSVSASTADTLGWVLYRRGEFNRAVALLQESASKLPDQAEVQFHLGMTQYMLGNEEPARVALQKAVQSTRQFDGNDQALRRLTLLALDPKTADSAAVSELQKQLQESPRDPIALDRLGAIQERDGAYDKAAGTYQAALKANAQDAGLTVKLAQLYAAKLNNPQKALELAKSAHDLAPDDPRVSALLGRLVYGTGDFKWATSLLEDSARKIPGDPQIAFDLAWAYYSVGRIAQAQNAMQTVAKAAPAFPKSDEAGRFLSLVGAAKDEASATTAAAEAQKFLSTQSNYVPALMVSALAQQAQGKSDAASEIYNRVLTQFPMFTPAVRNLGLIYFARSNDDQKAYELLTKAREALPQDPDVAKALGVLSYRKGNYDRAAQLLKQSLQMRNQDAEALFYLGMSQFNLKFKSESKASFMKALDFNLPARLEEEAKRVLLQLK